jgi:lipopolysaccharide/colanic/teichoic acid biosynthesis glycosyltransferase
LQRVGEVAAICGGLMLALHVDERVLDPIPKPFQQDPQHRYWMEIGGIPAVSVFETPFPGASGWLKRLEDIVISTIALLLLAMPMLAIAIGVRQSSPGPILFKQRRYGLAGEEIEVWSMSIVGPRPHAVTHNDHYR